MRRSKAAVRLVAEITRLGREGASRREVAAGLGVTLEELAARAREDAGLARALVLAEEAARAWWDGVPREALAAGARINTASWGGAMASRFGEAALPQPAARQTVDIDIPDNGRNRSRFPERRPPRDREEAEHFVGLWELAVENAEEGLEQAKQSLAEFGPPPDDDGGGYLVEDDPGGDDDAIEQETDE